MVEFSNKYVALGRLTGLESEKPDPSVPVHARIHDALGKEVPEYF